MLNVAGHLALTAPMTGSINAGVQAGTVTGPPFAILRPSVPP